MWSLALELTNHTMLLWLIEKVVTLGIPYWWGSYDEWSVWPKIEVCSWLVLELVTGPADGFRNRNNEPRMCQVIVLFPCYSVQIIKIWNLHGSINDIKLVLPSKSSTHWSVPNCIIVASSLDAMVTEFGLSLGCTQNDESACAGGWSFGGMVKRWEMEKRKRKNDENNGWID